MDACGAHQTYAIYCTGALWAGFGWSQVTHFFPGAVWVLTFSCFSPPFGDFGAQHGAKMDSYLGRVGSKMATHSQKVPQGTRGTIHSCSHILYVTPPHAIIERPRIREEDSSEQPLAHMGLSYDRPLQGCLKRL